MQLNIHRVKSIEVKGVKKLVYDETNKKECFTRDIIFTNEEGAQFEVTAFSDEKTDLLF